MYCIQVITCFLCPSAPSGAAHFSSTSLILLGILSPAQYMALDIVSGKNPFFPNSVSMVGSKPFPSIPTYRPTRPIDLEIEWVWQEEITQIHIFHDLLDNEYCFTYLPDIHIVAKGFQGSFQQDLSWQLARRIKDNVALNIGLHAFLIHSHLVVAGHSGVVSVGIHFSVLQHFHDLPTQPEERSVK